MFKKEWVRNQMIDIHELKWNFNSKLNNLSNFLPAIAIFDAFYLFQRRTSSQLKILSHVTVWSFHLSRRIKK